MQHRHRRGTAGIIVMLAALQAPSGTSAAPYRDDQCAVIIASRATLDDARSWIDAHPRYRIDAIYRASNGYYAVSSGLIQKDGWRGAVERLRSGGFVPEDAYCSGRGIVSLVAAVGRPGAPALTQETERAIAAANAARDAARREAEDARREAELARREADALREAERIAAVPPPAGKPRASGSEGRGTGSGFRITARGAILTNNPVVADCASVTADGQPVEILSSSATFDLAVLQPQPSGSEAGAWLAFSTEAPRLNADVTIAGYPLHGLLGGINVTRGTVTSLRGLFGDDSTMQFSAPIQNGNSGGAVSDTYGRVVGVVVSKINNDALKETLDVTAENVNFAIRGDIARLMLDRVGVDYETSDEKTPLAPEDLADKLTAATALVECM